MTDTLRVGIFVIATVHIIALIILIGFSVQIYLKANRNGLLYSFLAVQGSFLIWIFSKIFKTLSPVVELRWSFVVIQYLGISMLELSFLHFAYYYAYEKKLPKIIYKLGIPFIILQFMIIATNEYHHLFYSRFDFYSNSFGPLFKPYTNIMYACIIVGIVLVARKFKSDFYKQPAFYEVCLAILLPLFTNIFYLSGYYHLLMKQLGWQAFDITPIGFELSLIIFSYAIYRKDFLNIMPIFVDEIINQVTIGILLFDDKGYLIDANDLAKKYVIDGIAKTDLDEAEESTANVVCIDSGYYEIHNRKVVDHRERDMGRIVTIADVTPYMLLQQNLEEQIDSLETMTTTLEHNIHMNNDLMLVASRNFVARELHDILGHSMTLTIKLLEVALIECKEFKCSTDVEYAHKKKILKDKLNEAYAICSKGYNDLRTCLIDKQERSYDIISLKTEINKMSNVLRFAGIEFELSLPQVSGLFTENEFLVIKRFCQECVTNSIKHGKATYIHIIMDFENKPYRITVRDNGAGCEQLCKGNGLKGIEDRIKQIDGTLDWSSSAMNGFEIVLSY